MLLSYEEGHAFLYVTFFSKKKVTIGSSKEQFTIGEYRFEKVNGGVYQK